MAAESIKHPKKTCYSGKINFDIILKSVLPSNDKFQIFLNILMTISAIQLTDYVHLFVPDLDTKFLKHCAPVSSLILTHVYNLSLYHGCILNDFKT